MSTETAVPMKRDGEIKLRTPWKFRSRWCIRGCLVAESPLHVGSGMTTKRSSLLDEEGGRLVEIADCLRDVDDQPVLPATSLRGVLRAWIEAAVDKESEQFKRLLGEDSERNDSGRGGEAEFLDAYLSLPRRDDTPLPHWDPARQTWVEIINSIDRERGVAAENHLAHRETVAPGSGFGVEITGQFSEPGADIPLLLAALDAFNSGQIALGADTASGQGRMCWELETVQCIDEQDAFAWLGRGDGRGMAEKAFRALSPEELRRLNEEAEAYRQPGQNGELEIPLTLCFDGPFLVNDPMDEETRKKEKQKPPQERAPDVRPRKDEMGHAILPAKSFRGVLRAHGEKILRTLLQLDEEQWQDRKIQEWVEKHIACRPEIAIRACKPLKDKQDCKIHLCLACQVFGAPGWRSPLAVADLALEDNSQGYETQIQEMLAVDRFTGGGRDQAKYNTQAIIDPIFQGALRIDTCRLPPWGLGLLALVLRDLKEGRLRFGWGAAGKGYGHCKEADITLWDDPGFQKQAQTAWRDLAAQIDELIKELEEEIAHAEPQQNEEQEQEEQTAPERPFSSGVGHHE